MRERYRYNKLILVFIILLILAPILACDSKSTIDATPAVHRETISGVNSQDLAGRIMEFCGNHNCIEVTYWPNIENPVKAAVTWTEE